MLRLKSHFQYHFRDIIYLLLFLFPIIILSQEHHPHKHSEKDTLEVGKENPKMTSFLSTNLPMNRDGSATSWQPDTSPMWMYMAMKKNTSLMLHGSLFLRYTSQDLSKQGNRGGNQFDAPNMFMFRISQQIDRKNMLSAFTMLSFDAFTVGTSGYPLLFQTGESYKGVPLVDRQHPHDLFAELAINYTHSFTKDVDLNTYFGYPGEPALGPVAYLHRLSSMNNPDAPLGHHWQDATHTTFGVGTLGVRYQNIKVEGSIFTGREPDENRYNFDAPKFDSYSYRISANPNRNISLQFSQGFIKSPEELSPEQNITRTTASVMHTKLFNQSKFISSTLVWGMNHSARENLHSILFESNLQLTPITVYTRLELVQKDAHELHLEFNGNPIFNTNAVTLGLNKILLNNKSGNISIGSQATINLTDKDLKNIYGSSPLSGQVYLRFTPPSENFHHH